MRTRLDDGFAIWHHSIDMFALTEGGVARARLRPVREVLGQINPMSAQLNRWDIVTWNAVAAAL